MCYLFAVAPEVGGVLLLLLLLFFLMCASLKVHASPGCIPFLVRALWSGGWEHLFGSLTRCLLSQVISLFLFSNFAMRLL